MNENSETSSFYHFHIMTISNTNASSYCTHRRGRIVWSHLSLGSFQSLSLCQRLELETVQCFPVEGRLCLAWSLFSHSIVSSETIITYILPWSISNEQVSDSCVVYTHRWPSVVRLAVSWIEEMYEIIVMCPQLSL